VLVVVAARGGGAAFANVEAARSRRGTECGGHRLEEALFVAAVFAMPLLSGVLLTVGRFGLLVFPLFFALADLALRRPAVHQAYLAYAPVAQLLLLASAALGYRPP